MKDTAENINRDVELEQLASPLEDMPTFEEHMTKRGSQPVGNDSEKTFIKPKFKVELDDERKMTVFTWGSRFKDISSEYVDTINEALKEGTNSLVVQAESGYSLAVVTDNSELRDRIIVPNLNKTEGVEGAPGEDTLPFIIAEHPTVRKIEFGLDAITHHRNWKGEKANKYIFLDFDQHGRGNTHRFTSHLDYGDFPKSSEGDRRVCLSLNYASMKCGATIEFDNVKIQNLPGFKVHAIKGGKGINESCYFTYEAQDLTQSVDVRSPYCSTTFELDEVNLPRGNGKLSGFSCLTREHFEKLQEMLPSDVEMEFGAGQPSGDWQERLRFYREEDNQKHYCGSVYRDSLNDCWEFGNPISGDMHWCDTPEEYIEKNILSKA